MKFGLIANLKREGAVEAINAFVRWCEASHSELVLCEEISSVIGDSHSFDSRTKVAQGVDILVTMGGDGTLLASARAVGDSGTPLLGINLGSLGFLTQLTPQQLLPALDLIVKKQYHIEERMLLKAEIQRDTSNDTPYALNDVVIDNGPISRIIDINLRVNGEDIVTYKADGLVIATPTGSTAYSLAVGGPIMHPKMQAMIAAPISAFSLNTRPMIFAAEDLLEVRVTTERHQAMMTIDGQVARPISGEKWVKIKRADFHTKFIVFPENTFYKILRNKLHWGYSPTTVL